MRKLTAVLLVCLLSSKPVAAHAFELKGNVGHGLEGFHTSIGFMAPQAGT